MMKAAYAELMTKTHRRPELDLPRILVAAPSATASSTIAQALSGAGYVVSTTRTGPDLLRTLRTQAAIELLVLDVADTPWIVGSTIEAVRALDWALPIILIARPEPALHAEAERLGVQAILDAQVAAEEIRRAATSLVPVVPEVVLDRARPVAILRPRERARRRFQQHQFAAER